MKWKIDFSPKWTRWFAWHPIQIGETRIWWEWVERNLIDYCDGPKTYNYREIQSK